MAKAGEPYRIVHLSDLHLTRSDGRARTEMDLFRPLRGMNAAFRKVLDSDAVHRAHRILVTGDVTDRGDAYSWEIFWKELEARDLAEKALVVPGNHDVCCLGVRLPGARKGYRKEDLRKAAAGLRRGGLPVRFPWAVRTDPRVAVFGLNSNNLGNLTAAGNALGDLGYYQLKGLAESLHRHRDAPVKIVALHHSPNIPGEDTARKRGQRPLSALERLGHQIPRPQRQALLLLCVTHRVRLLLHGHLHTAEDRRVSGIRIVGAPAATEPDGSGNLRFWDYAVSPDGGRVRCTLAICGG